MMSYEGYSELAANSQAPQPPKPSHALVARLPITMRPALNEQLRGWESLFPYERRRLLGFLHGIESYSTADWQQLTAPLARLEEKMGVAHWDFSEQQDTMENASQLARSAFYVEWREEVQLVFKAVEAAAEKAVPRAPKIPRLVLLVLPENLPVEPPEKWRPWAARGRAYRVEGSAVGLDARISGGLAAALALHAPAESADLWLIDAGAELPSQNPGAAEQLHYARLLPFRDKFLEEVNKMPKNLAVSDKTLAEVRRQNWEHWCPDELKEQPRLRNFLVDLLLSGNGALIYSSAFVEWASSEALRRARPRALVARFGMRAKPKPFTGIAIFENQQKISTLPEVDDPEGSALDALELARYVWLAAQRYPEQEQTIGLCIAEHANAVYVMAPEALAPAWPADQPVSPEEIAGWVHGVMVG